MIEHAAAALFFDPGLGKTSVTLAAIKFLLKAKVLNKVLLIAPLRVCHSVWPQEVKKWHDFKRLKVVVLHGKNKKELLNSNAHIYVINPEGLDWLLNTKKTKMASGKTKVEVNLKQFKELGFDTLIIDELSKFKHINTSRFKALKHVLGTFQRRWGLTGSPATNGLLDLFGQCYVLDQGRSLGQYISHYRNKYFEQSYDGFSWILRKDADKEIYGQIKPLALRMGQELLDMPAIIENNIKVELPEKAFKIYLKLEKDLITEIGAETASAKTAASASIKCRQVASGAVYLDQEVEALIKLPSSQKKWVEIHKTKLDVLQDLIEELQGSPLLVAYDFQHDLERLTDRFGVKDGKKGKKVPYIGGGVSIKDAAKWEKMWNAGELPVLFGHPQAMGHGLNLQKCGHHIAWFSLTWDFELYDQFNRRVFRQGNTSKKVFIHHIIAKDTIDEAVLIALKQKRSGQNALFNALKEKHNIL